MQMMHVCTCHPQSQAFPMDLLFSHMMALFNVVSKPGTVFRMFGRAKRKLKYIAELGLTLTQAKMPPKCSYTPVMVVLTIHFFISFYALSTIHSYVEINYIYYN